jgi:Domain of unknown function (DUF4396)
MYTTPAVKRPAPPAGAASTHLFAYKRGPPAAMTAPLSAPPMGSAACIVVRTRLETRQLTSRFSMENVNGGDDPARSEFWFNMSMALLAGFVFAYPINWWLVANHMKHGRQAQTCSSSEASTFAPRFVEFIACR